MNMKKLMIMVVFFSINSGLNCFLNSEYKITLKSGFVLVLSSILFAVFMSFFMKKSDS